jgi:glyoxylase-like metal-dependent hydrolase (beta-lactamase superfamily II)
MKTTLSLLLVALLLASGCALTTHAHQRSSLGVPRRAADLLAVIDQPGPIEVETVNSTDWAVDRGGLINLGHPSARAAHLTDDPEPIQIYFHALHHPQRGLYIVDSGVERAMRDARERAAIRGFIASYMKIERMKFHAPLGDWLAAQSEPLRGIFLTHLHLDHVSGLPDAPHEVRIYTGPGEAGERTSTNIFVRSSIDRALAGHGPLEEWAFSADPDGRFAGVIDIFGDGSLWAIHVPGHTAGSTAYLARTPRGPVLLTGDCSHTVWGWQHDVEPGSFTADHAKNADSLARLRRLVKEHPAIDVRLGHQSLPARTVSAVGLR